VQAALRALDKSDFFVSFAYYLLFTSWFGHKNYILIYECDFIAPKITNAVKSSEIFFDSPFSISEC
jgi:hypothetical protein